MATRNDSTSNVLLVLVLIITFPIWIALLAGLFGVAIGLFGAAIGVIAALFGAMVALLVLPFKILFGWGHHGWHWFPHFHFHWFWPLMAIIVAALIVKGRRTA